MMGLRASGLAAQDSVLPLPAEIAQPEQRQAPSRRSRSPARLGQTRTYHKSTYSGANPIRNVVGGLDLGVEALYGWVKNKNGATANAPRFQFTGRYTFVKLHP